MGQAQLVPRPLYGIGTVARLTGLKPDTLRVWERRYRLGASFKSTTGRRQYTQADLEHLQLVAALVSAGARIGEIASSDRKTLERLIEVRAPAEHPSIPEAKPRVVCIGRELCAWLDQHQGCLSGVDAQLAPIAPSEVEPELFTGLPQIDLLVVQCTRLGSRQAGEVARLRRELQPSSVLCLFTEAADCWVRELGELGVACSSFPPDRAELAFHFAQTGAGQDVKEGIGSLGDLVKPRPRLFSAETLAAASTLETSDCTCPQHLADLVSRLADFEEYSTRCSVENWEDAAVHSCVYAYASQARWLTEKALELLLQSHQDASSDSEAMSYARQSA